MNLKKKFATGVLACVLCATTLFGGCGKIDPNAVLVTVGDDTITLGYYNFAAKYQQSIYDINYGSMMGEDMWTQSMGGSTTFADTVKSTVLNTVQAAYLCKQHASEYGVELTAEDQKAIDETAQKFMDDNSKKTIKTMGATLDYVKEFLTYSFYQEKVSSVIRSQAELNVTDEEANQSTVSYVYFSTAPTTDSETGEEVPMAEETKASLLAQAQQLADSSEFAATAETLELTVSTHTYTTSADPAEDTTLGEEVIKAANVLSEGAHSGVIEVADKGYYVVRMDMKLDADATAKKRESLENAQKDNHYQEVLQGWIDSADWEAKEDLLKQVKFDKRFSYAGPTE